MKKLIEMLERAYELGMQAQNNEVDQGLAEEVTSESAELLAMLNNDWSAFESEEVMDAELLKLTKVINLLDEATTIIYNMEGDLFQDNYDRLEAILDSLKQTEV
jgi:hypothetical protein